MTNENKGKSLVKGTLIYAIGNFGTKILSFLIVPLYTYFIAPEAMGDFDLVQTTVSLFAPLITLRISDAAYRWMLHGIEEDKKCISATYRVMIYTSVIAVAVLSLINCIVPVSYFWYFAGFLVFGRWLETFQLLLRGLKKQSLFAVSGILFTAIYLGLNVILVVLLRQGVDALFQSTLISEIITIIFILIRTKELRTGIINSDENRQLTKDMLKYSLPLIPSGLSWWVMSASDRYVIRLFLGRAATGIYAVANKFPTIISTVFLIFNYSWTDVAIGNLKEGEETTEYSSKLFKQLYTISFTFLLVLIPATKIVTTTILSDSYKISSIYIGFLYLGAVFQGLTTFISAGMLQRNDTKLIARSSTIGAVVNLAVDIIAMKFIGIHAASVSTFLGGFVMWLCRMKDLEKISPIRINKYLFSILLVLCMLMAIISIWSNNITDIILTIICGVIFIVVNRDMLRLIVNKAVRKI